TVEERPGARPTHAPERGVVIEGLDGGVVRLVHAVVAAVTRAVLPQVGDAVPPLDDPRAGGFLPGGEAGAVQPPGNPGHGVEHEPPEELRVQVPGPERLVLAGGRLVPLDQAAPESLRRLHCPDLDRSGVANAERALSLAQC